MAYEALQRLRALCASFASFALNFMHSAVRTPDGRLVANLMHFARTLRAAGMPVGPGKVLDAVAAVEAVGIHDRRDFYWTLHAVFVNRADQRVLFDQAFHVF